MTDATPAQILRSRIRKYFLVVFGMFLGAAVLLVVVGVVLKTLAPSGAATAMGILAPVAMLSVVVGSWVAVSKLWRCPACDKNVYWVISMNMSILASQAPSTCPGCGVTLFDTADRQRRGRRFLVLIVLAVVLGIAGAMASGFMAQKRAQQEKVLPVG